MGGSHILFEAKTLTNKQYLVKKAHQKSNAYKVASGATKTPNTRLVGIIVNDWLELVVSLVKVNNRVQIALGTVDDDTQLTQEDIDGITKAFASKYL